MTTPAKRADDPTPSDPAGSKPRKVWVVSEGEYSDYRVLAVFETEADAQAAVALGLGGDVEERTFYPTGVAPTKHIEWRAWATVGDKLGNDREPYATSDVEWNFLDREVAPKQPDLRQFRNGLGIGLTAWSSDREAVLKAVSDRYAQLKAEREGL